MIADRCDCCPICGAFGGFHDDEPHHVAAAHIPAHLLLPTSTDTRRQRQTRRREQYAQWLATQGATPGEQALADHLHQAILENRKFTP